MWKRISIIFIGLISFIIVLLIISYVTTPETIVGVSLAALGYIFSAILAFNLMRDRLDMMMQAFYQKNGLVTDEFCDNVEKFKDQIGQLKELNIQNYIEKIGQFISSLKKFGKYGIDHFYPIMIRWHFYSAKKILMKIEPIYKATVEPLRDFEERIINNPEIDLKHITPNWSEQFKKIFRWYISAFLKLKPFSENLEKHFKGTQKDEEIFIALQPKIDKFIRQSNLESKKDFFKRNAKAFRKLNKIYKNFKKFIDENYIIFERRILKESF
ncbi:MAG: hypothetical protein ACTSRC_20225 [Candidatus Helarchaeota archaeon]